MPEVTWDKIDYDLIDSVDISKRNSSIIVNYTQLGMFFRMLKVN